MCLPLPGTPANTHFQLSFFEGGVGTFLPLFFDLLNRNRVGPAHAPTGDPPFLLLLLPLLAPLLLPLLVLLLLQLLLLLMLLLQQQQLLLLLP